MAVEHDAFHIPFMINVTVLYPHSEGAHFDFTYYCSQHIPLMEEKLGSTLISLEIDKGIAPTSNQQPPRFVATLQMRFHSLEEFEASFIPNGPTFRADMPNYTNIVPIIQINEVVMFERTSTTHRPGAPR